MRDSVKKIISEGLGAGVICGLLWASVLTFLHYAPVPITYYRGPKLSLIFAYMASLNLLVPVLLCVLFGMLGAVIGNSLKSNKIWGWATAGALLPVLFCMFMPSAGVNLKSFLKAAIFSTIASLCIALFLLSLQLEEPKKIAGALKKSFWFWYIPLVIYISIQIVLFIFDWKTLETNKNNAIVSSLLLFEVAILIYLWVKIGIFNVESLLKNSALAVIIFALCSSFLVISPYSPELQRFNIGTKELFVIVSAPVVLMISYLISIVSAKFQKVCQAFLQITFFALFITWAILQISIAIPLKGADVKNMPNIVLITFDSLRADVLEPYGGDVQTPHFSEFAKNNILFENALTTATWTLPSIASILTGLYPPVHSVNWDNPFIGDNYPTLQSLLKSHGYHTYAIVDQYFVLKISNLYRDFDMVIGTAEQERLAKSPIAPELFRFAPVLGWSIQEKRPTLDHAEGVLKFLELIIPRLKRPFFLWIYFLDPHYNYMPPKRYLDPSARDRKFEWFDNRKHRVLSVFQPSRLENLLKQQPELLERTFDLYKGEVKYADSLLGTVLNTLQEQDWYGSSIVVLFSDHGEEFLEHGSLEHGHSVYKELAHIPLIMKIPGYKPARIKTRVALFDIFPTILDLAGVDYSNLIVQAESLLPVIRGESAEDREIFVEGSLGKLAQGLYSKNYLIASVKDEAKNIDRFELYELTSDPAQKNPLPTSGELFDSLESELMHYLDDSKALWESFANKPEDALKSEEAIEKLKALGYIH